MYEQISSNLWRSRILLGLFVALLCGLGVVFYQVYEDPFIVPLAVALAIFTSIGGYYYSDRIVLYAMRAREADRSEFAHYVNSVEGLAIAAGIPCPKPYVIDDPAPNAFATGRDPEHAAICVTTGLLDIMDRVELEGVISHEMSHIKNYDIRFMTVVAVLAGSIALMADLFWRSLRYRGIIRMKSRRTVQLQALFFLLGLICAILAPTSAALLQAAISRKREYLADASGALLTRYPEGLASALEKIAADPNKLAVANKATAHMFIANPLKDHGGPVNGLFDTHPPIAERIRRLREM